MTVIRFRGHYHVQRLPPDLVFLFTETQSHTLTGTLYYALAPLLMQAHTRADLIAALEGQFPPLQVGYALNRLLNQGYLIETDSAAAPTPQAIFWEMQPAPTSQAARPLTVNLHVFGAVPTGGLMAALDAAHLTVSPSAPGLVIALTDDYLHPDLDNFNRTMGESGQAWLLVKPIGEQVWLGPLIEPGESACWMCLAQRLSNNRAVEMFVTRQHGGIPLNLSRAALPGMSGAAYHLVAAGALTWLKTGQSPLHNALMTLDARTLTTEYHALVRRPQCPACGDATPRPPDPIQLASQPRFDEGDGGYRSRAAAVTLARYRHHISPITGAVSGLERLPSPDFIHVYASGSNKARSFKQWGNFRRNLRSQSAGKGRDAIQAQVSALCEALERYSGLHQGKEFLITAPYSALPDDAPHPESYLLYSPRQYAERETWNATCPPHLFVPEPFDAARPIAWTPAWSLREERFTYLPAAYCFYDYTAPDEPTFCMADSNGNAAGSSLEDAILQGFLELVERDAVAVWWYNRLAFPAVDLRAYPDPYITAMQGYYAALGREFWVLNLTHDLGIPVCAAVSRTLNSPQEDIIFGFGAHLDPRVAVLRALTELNQILPSVLAYEGQPGYASQSPWELTWWQTATLENQPYLAPSGESPLTPAPFLSDDLRDDVLGCVNLLAAQDMDMLVVNQTRADIGLPVVKVVVSGLRHFWGRFAPGRLYDVPVRLGWQSEPTPEAQLNPNPMFM